LTFRLSGLALISKHPPFAWDEPITIHSTANQNRRPYRVVWRLETFGASNVSSGTTSQQTA
jgi:hypothetical protein